MKWAMLDIKDFGSGSTSWICSQYSTNTFTFLIYFLQSNLINKASKSGCVCYLSQNPGSSLSFLVHLQPSCRHSFAKTHICMRTKFLPMWNTYSLYLWKKLLLNWHLKQETNFSMGLPASLTFAGCVIGEHAKKLVNHQPCRGKFFTSFSHNLLTS